MPSLNLDIDFFSHPKTKRLTRLLGRGSEVVPLRLWCYTARYFAADGKLTDISAEEIENECQWWGEKGVAVKAMIDCVFIEQKNGHYYVHDWAEHEGHIQAFKERGKAGANARWNALSKASSNASSIPLSNAPTMLTNQHSQPTQKGSALKQLEGRVSAIYKRGESDRWSYDEQYALAEVSRRDNALSEMDEIVRFRRFLFNGEKLNYFPQTILSLLTKWTETLDKSRIQCPAKTVKPASTVAVKKPEMPLSDGMLRESIAYLEKHNPKSPMLAVQKKQLEELERK